MDERSGQVSILVSGAGTKDLFKDEAGGHRWQRVPPTEKRGRVQTSTVTVAVLDPEGGGKFNIDERDVEITTTRGSGPGGQHRNKTESCVVAVHRPTGKRVRIDMRSQAQSRVMAIKLLAAKLAEDEAIRTREARGLERRQQVGSGQRGDKIRTYREQDDRVTDHKTGKTWKLSKWRKGDW